MSDKTETISIRVTPEMATALDEWSEENGYDGRADAIRGLIRQICIGEANLHEYEHKDEVLEKLDEIKHHIREYNRPLWERLWKEENE